MPCILFTQPPSLPFDGQSIKSIFYFLEPLLMNNLIGKKFIAVEHTIEVFISANF